MIPVRAAHGVISGEHQQDTRRMVKLAHLVFSNCLCFQYFLTFTYAFLMFLLTH